MVHNLLGGAVHTNTRKNRAMNFPQNCREASTRLQQLSGLANALDIDLLRLEDDRRDTEVLTSMVQKFREAGSLSEDLLHHYIPAVEGEEPCVAVALKIAHEELFRRVIGARHDLEVMTRRRDVARAQPRLRRVG